MLTIVATPRAWALAGLTLVLLVLLVPAGSATEGSATPRPTPSPPPTYAFVARADLALDALGASALAGTLGAPVLITEPGGLAPAVADRLAGLGPQQVVLVGGDEALDPSVEADVRALGLPVRRIAGDGRRETALALSKYAEELGVSPPLLSAATATPTSPPDDDDAGEGEVQQDDGIFLWLPQLDGWERGLFLFLLGAAGALVMAFFSIDGFLPSMGGKVEYQLDKERLAEMEEALDRSLDRREKMATGGASPPDAQLAADEQLADDLTIEVHQLRNELTRRRLKLFLMGFPMYVTLGGLFAAALATTWVQALAIGFGWTAVADRFGLRSETQRKRDARDRVISDQQQRIAEERAAAAGEIATLRAQRDAALDSLVPEPGGVTGR